MFPVCIVCSVLYDNECVLVVEYEREKHDNGRQMVHRLCWGMFALKCLNVCVCVCMCVFTLFIMKNAPPLKQIFLLSCPGELDQ